MQCRNDESSELLTHHKTVEERIRFVVAQTPTCGANSPGATRHNVDAFGWRSYPNHAEGKDRKAVLRSARRHARISPPASNPHHLAISSSHSKARHAPHGVGDGGRSGGFHPKHDAAGHTAPRVLNASRETGRIASQSFCSVTAPRCTRGLKRFANRTNTGT